MKFKAGDIITGENESLLILFVGKKKYFCEVWEYHDTDEMEERGDEVSRCVIFIENRYGIKS